MIIMVDDFFKILMHNFNVRDFNMLILICNRIVGNWFTKYSV